MVRLSFSSALDRLLTVGRKRLESRLRDAWGFVVDLAPREPYRARALIRCEVEVGNCRVRMVDVLSLSLNEFQEVTFPLQWKSGDGLTRRYRCSLSVVQMGNAAVICEGWEVVIGNRQVASCMFGSLWEHLELDISSDVEGPPKVVFRCRGTGWKHARFEVDP